MWPVVRAGVQVLLSHVKNVFRILKAEHDSEQNDSAGHTLRHTQRPTPRLCVCAASPLVSRGMGAAASAFRPAPFLKGGASKPLSVFVQ